MTSSLTDATGGAARPRSGRSGRLVDTAHEHLRAQILSGVRLPGQRMQDSVLATELGMSRAPVREALRMLEQSGLLVKDPNHSYAVRSFSDDDLYELATLRLALESFAAELAFGSATTVARLRERLADMVVAVEADDVAAALEADRRFHETVVECAGHRRLSRVYADLLDEIQLALQNVANRRPALDGMVERHARLVGAFDGGTLDDLLQELAEHIRSGSGISPLASYMRGR